MSKFEPKIIYAHTYTNFHNNEIRQNMVAGQSIAIEVVRNPLRERARREIEIRSDRERKLVELKSHAQNNQIVALKAAIKVLEGHQKRLTQDGLQAKSGGKSGGFDQNAFKKDRETRNQVRDSDKHR